MSETWTEYAVRESDWPERDTFRRLDDARITARNYSGKVFGRQVTASDWLPVDGAK